MHATETIHYKPQGVCSREIEITLEDGVIRHVQFTGGCSGNTQGLSQLLVGMRAEEAIKRLSGIRCGLKQTSCPDQLARALRGFLSQEAE